MGRHHFVPGLPYHACEISPRRLAAFKNFLHASGAEIFSSANAYEIVRFRAGGETCVIYRRKSGLLKYIGPVRTAWQAFVSHGALKAVPRQRRPRADERSTILAALLQRDGPECFYCAEDVLPGEETIEHLLPITAGGPVHLANSALAHRACNELAGHRSLAEKIKLRDFLRSGGVKMLSGMAASVARAPAEAAAARSIP